MTHTYQVEVENIKCGGCENSIVKGINSVAKVTDLVIDREKQLVSFSGEESIKQLVIDKLKSMGYPEKAQWRVLRRALPMPNLSSAVP